MYFHVSLQLGTLRARVAAYDTLVRFLTGVGSAVDDQIALKTKPFPTELASSDSFLPFTSSITATTSFCSACQRSLISGKP
jgi:hypothetical protein